MVTLVRPLQPANALPPIEVTELGIIVFLHPLINVFVAVSIMALQFSRELYTELPLSTFMLVKPLQLENAPVPIEVTELGMVTLVRPLQLRNAPSPIEVTELGMVTLVKPLQPRNASSPISMTELGIVTLVRPLQP